ncbi:MAG: acetate/propionate family kinase [Rhodocyclales bacterium GT-UBC]|nr:MAG: acetate/propionate family kinase [Rhodocyclales bacterium GT-UBC]
MSKHQSCLVLNAGSSSLKFSVFRQQAAAGNLNAILTGQISGIGGAARFEAKDADRRQLADHSWDDSEPMPREKLLRFALHWIHEHLVDDEIVAAGHRVVHGGKEISAPLRIDAAAIDALEALVPLAPLHQPHNVAAIRMLAEIYPELSQVACFDTAFHATQPWQARTFALPKELSDEGVCKYGFHGLSYEYVTHSLLAARPELANGRIAICHLGNGSSLCAVQAGESVDTSMSFSALDGVPMGTRCGALDPGVLLYLMREKQMGLEEIEDLLYRRSGLLGVSGISNDMKVLQETDDPDARKAVELFCHRVAREVAAMAAAMEGIDALVFTAGIGENSPAIREMISRRLGWLGVQVDAARNAGRQFEISAADSRIPVFVVPTNEELMIAKHTLAVLNPGVGHA